MAKRLAVLRKALILFTRILASLRLAARWMVTAWFVPGG